MPEPGLGFDLNDADDGRRGEHRDVVRGGRYWGVFTSAHRQKRPVWQPANMQSKSNLPFNAQAFLDSTGIARKAVDYRRGDTIFSQGDACDTVMYIQKGGVKLSVISKAGREAVVAMLGPGDFFGEGSLAGQPVRMGSATALTGSTILRIEKQKMIRL